MNRRTAPHHDQPRPPARAFTLIELITVIAVMAILITIGVPAFRAAIESSNKALSESQFRIGIESARQLAIQNSSRDSAAVFMYEPFAAGGPKLTIVPCIYAGTMLDYKDRTQTSTGDTLEERDIFVPVPEISPVQLPSGWMVRGYAPPGSIDDNDPTRNNRNGWYEETTGRVFEPSAAVPRGNWVFPENAFYLNVENSQGTSPQTLQAQGINRQTFMIRFKAGSGNVDPSDSRLCLVINTAPSQVANATTGAVTKWRDTGADPVFADPVNRIDEATDLQRFVRRLLARADLDNSGMVDPADEESLRTLIGDKSCDSILTRPLTELALYREKSLAAALGGSGINRDTGCIYADVTSTQPAPRIDLNLFNGLTTADVATRTNLWITGKLLEDGTGPAYAESDAKLFAMDRYLGQGRKLGDDREVTP